MLFQTGSLRAAGHCHHVAAGIMPAVEGGILPPGGAPRACGTAIPPGEMPGSTAGRMPAATAQVGGRVQMRPLSQAASRYCRHGLLVDHVAPVWRGTRGSLRIVPVLLLYSSCSLGAFSRPTRPSPGLGRDGRKSLRSRSQLAALPGDSGARGLRPSRAQRGTLLRTPYSSHGYPMFNPCPSLVHPLINP